MPTMIFGVLGAISKNNIRGILSFHIVSQIGFMVLAIGLFTPFSIAACIFYIMHHIVVKSSLFLVGGVAARLNGSYELNRMGNLWKQTPWLGVLFLFQALSLAGLPPLSGFWGKYMIIVEGVRQGAWVLVAASIIASILTLFSMLKIWLAAFWREHPKAPVETASGHWQGMSWVVAGMVGISIFIGFGAEFIFQIAERAAAMLLDQQAYIDAVMSVQGKG
jgi:multicomponent Na+:H+ antiporter subunit D